MPILALSGPTKLDVIVDRLRGLEAAGVQDTRFLWDQLPYRVRTLVYPQERNQRAADRMPSGLPVMCRVGQTWVQGVIANISRLGMFVKLEDAPKPGLQVLLQFLLPAIPRLFEVRARVVWAARPEHGAAVPGMGAEFLDLDEAGSAAIDAAVRRDLEEFSRIPTA